MNEDQKEELDALRAIFGDDFTDVCPDPPSFMIKLSDLDVSLKGPLSLKLTLDKNYPNQVPEIELPMRLKVLSDVHCVDLKEHLKSVAKENLGTPMIYTLVDEAKNWLSENAQQLQEDEEQLELQEVVTEQLPPAQTNSVILTEPKVTGGRWDYVIGLVGKPSAGKSTFFNAATTLDMAKTGAHPFTTIEPNIGRAFYSIPCPCSKWTDRCNAAYGHSHTGDRYIPVLLKDVAGLVPGACEGKGRGNRFLNDLLDADVLIHIIDVSGCTNEKGEVTTGYDPALDVSWLQHELHQWIYDNVKNKWDIILRRPQKLVDMFTGYHANRSTIHTALQNAGIDSRKLSSLSTWTDDVLDRIVSEFLRLRFPIFLALNKADMPTAKANIERMQATFDSNPPSLAVSSRSECILQRLQKSGKINYSYGSNDISATEQQLLGEEQQQLSHIQQGVIAQYDSTNVHKALCEAVSLRRPSYAFPVHDLDTLTSIDKYRGEEPGRLRDCVSLRPGTTVEEMCTVMLHYPLQLLAGDFIRAECVDSEGKRRIVRKEENVQETNCIIKIFTNRKVSQVKARD